MRETGAASGLRARRAILPLAGALLGAGLLFRLFPGLDLAAARPFHDLPGGFFLADSWFALFFFRGIDIAKWLAIAAMIAVPLAALALRRWFLPVAPRDFAALALSLALGAGLVVNLVLKDHWGRARPSQTVEFGGARAFTPAFVKARECERNCSFSAGHPAFVFSFFALALVLPRRHQRRTAAAVVAGLGAAAGLGRMMQGGHYVSDVVASGLICALAAALVVAALDAAQRRGWLAPDAPRRALARARERLRDRHMPRLSMTGPARRRGVVPALCVSLLVAIAFSYAWIDRPVAIWARGLEGGEWRAFFRGVSSVGQATPWIAGLAALALAFWLAGHFCARFAEPLQRTARQSLFLLACAGLPALFGNLAKMALGRARPRLYLERGEYGFAPFSTDWLHHSLPSGHAAVACGLAMGASLLWPRLAPLWGAAALAVSASRVILGAHYVSDVLASALLAGLFALAIREICRRIGLDPVAATPARVPS